MLFFFLSSLALLGNGEILDVQGLQVQKHENSVLIDGNNVENLPTTVDVTDLGDLVTRSFWAGQMKESSAIKLNQQHSTSNLFIVNFGTDGSILKSKHELKGTNTGLTYDFFPADSVSVLTSMATSQSPLQHGVVGKSWSVDSQPIEAYSEPKTFSSKHSFTEVIDLDAITGSSNPKLARALNQHHPIDTINGDKFESSHGIDFTKQEAMDALQNEDFWSLFSSQLESLDLSDPSVESFIMDMEYMRRLGKSMESNKQPTLYNMATTTPSNPAAHEILLGALSHVQKQFKTQYPEGSSQIVFFKEPTVVSNSNAETKTSLFYQAMQLSESLTNGVVRQDPRSYQIAIWLTIFSIIIVYYFVYDFMTLDYETDATLFTKWQRGTKIDARMGPMSGMDGLMGDVRF